MIEHIPARDARRRGVRTRGRFDYDELARAYNAAKLTDFLVFPYPPKNLSNLKVVLAGRGLIYRHDYTAAARTDRDGTYTVTLQKLTVRPLREGPPQ